MSSPTRLASTALVTFWNVTAKDKFGRAGYSDPVVVNCCIDTGQRRQHTSKKGEVFTPIITAWFEFDGFTPGDGAMMAKGDHSAASNPQSVSGCYNVRDVVIQDCSMLGEDDDVMVVA